MGDERQHVTHDERHDDGHNDGGESAGRHLGQAYLAHTRQPQLVLLESAVELNVEYGQHAHGQDIVEEKEEAYTIGERVGGHGNVLAHHVLLAFMGHSELEEAGQTDGQCQADQGDHALGHTAT